MQLEKYNPSAASEEGCLKMKITQRKIELRGRDRESQTEDKAGLVGTQPVKFIGPCTWEGPTLGLMLCRCHFEIISF